MKVQNIRVARQSARRVSLCVLGFCSLVSTVAVAVAEEIVLAEDLVEEPISTYEGGYFPTIEETQLLGGDYPRSRSESTGGPDFTNLSATGAVPYPSQARVNRAPWADSLNPLNPYLGFFAHNDGLVIEGESYPNGLTGTLDGGLPLLTRNFNPERAHIKAGPLYADLLYLGTEVIYSDYDGTRKFRQGEEDGWLFGVSMGVRILLQVTDEFFLTAAGNLIYLPQENQLGFFLGTGGEPAAFASLNYQAKLGDWNIHVYDNFTGAIGLDLFADIDSDAYKRAGRYSFGFANTDRSTDLWDGDNVIFANTVGLDASRPVWDDWRWWIGARHRDSWRTYDFDDHTNSDEAYTRIGYNGVDIPFAPYAEYRVSTYDDWDAFYHRVYVGANGRLSENITLNGRVGYLFTSGNASTEDQILWNLRLTHEIGPRTWHSIEAGQDFVEREIIDATAVSSYVRYDINHQFTRSLSAGLYGQYSDDQNIRGSFDGHRTQVGALVDWKVAEGVNGRVYANGVFERRDDGLLVEDRWIGRVGYSQQITSRLTGNLYYQYEEAEEFSENLFGLSLRQSF